ncbi:glycosyltransferase family 61 protein [Foetidibacter luteolus]|uniref:glycosyltransferase family 61 protein n=1 Tax=Foetidibacter luteolus TaxID=2608880 RepID=UPI00129A66BA|nr:glycosyltransferase 61 family protein [Foetidibacter luteolus]
MINHWTAILRTAFYGTLRNIDNGAAKILLNPGKPAAPETENEDLFSIVSGCTISHRFGIVKTADGSFFLHHLLPQNYRNRYAHLFAKDVLAEKINPSVSHSSINAIYVWGNKWSRGYYHFIVEDLPAMLYAKDKGLPIYSWVVCKYRWQKDLLQMFELHYEQVTAAFVARKMYHVPARRIFIDLFNYSIPHPQLLTLLQQKLAEVISRMTIPMESGDYCAWISRKYTASRHVENEEDCFETLRSKGVKVVVLYPEQMSIAAQVAAISNARLIIGGHGAGLASLIFTQHAELAEIGPPQKVNNSFISIASALNRPYTYFTAKALTPYFKSRSNFFVEPGQLAEVVVSLLHNKKAEQ